MKGWMWHETMVMTDKCIFKGCERDQVCKKYCAMHYNSLWKSKSHLLGKITKRPIVRKKCRVSGCGKDSQSKDYCFQHYYRHKRYGDPEYACREFVKCEGKCIYKGCAKKQRSKYLCIPHYKRLYYMKKHPGSRMNIKNRDTCIISVCKKIPYARNFCRNHYMQFRYKRLKELKDNERFDVA